MRLTPHRSPTSLEERAAARPWSARVSLVFVLTAAALAVLAGAAIADGREQVAILSIGALLALAIFRYLELPAWCSLVLLTAIAARGLSALLGLPEIVDFIHYAVVVLFALAAVDQPRRAASLAPGRWLVIFVLVVLLSAIAHPDDPMRTALFLLIAGEPLLVIWAIARWGTDPKTLRTVGVVAFLLAAIQVPLGVYQGLTYGWSDPVQGTLSGHGAGTHVLGALFALGSFILIAAILARRLSLVVGSVGLALCFGMLLATGSMAVLVVAAIVSALEAIIGPSRLVSIRGSRRLGTILLALVLGASVLALVAVWVPGFYERAVSLATSREPAGLGIISERAATEPLTALLGSGPGTSASRASLLLVEPPEGSPLAFIGLEPTDLGLALLAATSDETHGGSVESAASSALGVVGDLGLIGLVALAMLFLALWRLAGKSRSWLAPAARSGILMVAALSLVDNWLEYPEFAIPFAILIGLVISDVPETERE